MTLPKKTGIKASLKKCAGEIEAFGEKRPIWTFIFTVFVTTGSIALEHLNLAWKDWFWERLKKYLIVEEVFQSVGFICLVILAALSYQYVKKKSKNDLLATLLSLVPWIGLLFIFCLAAARTYNWSHHILHKTKTWSSGTVYQLMSDSPEPVWIDSEAKEGILNEIAKTPLPKPLKPILIALSSRNKETENGGKAMRDLLVAAHYPVESNFVFTVGLYQKEGTSHKYIVVHPISRTSDSRSLKQSYIAQQALLKAIEPYLSVDGGRSFDLAQDQICIYVQDLKPTKN